MVQEPGKNVQKDASRSITWVDEGGNLRQGKSAGMSDEAYAYQSGATGARSNSVTGRSQAPQLEYLDASGNAARVKFDGIDGDQAIDRKSAIHTGSKTQLLAQRQSAALQQNGMTGVWEVPSVAEAARANRVLEAAGASNITVKVVPR
jgi:filamentous hemagglutinin